MTPVRISEARLRDELAMLKARYDCESVSPAVYSVIRSIEVDISWLQHRRFQREVRS
jgi:hypothetical protein